MKVAERASLAPLNSFGVAATAGLLITIEQEEDVLELPPFNPARDLVLGDGSNILFAGDVPGTVLHNRIPGRSIVDDDGAAATLEVGAGENWHALVRWTLEQGLFGLENLSLIPGSAGAAPIQNIGAYGVELSSVLERVTAWDWKAGTWVSLGREDCRLGYRDSLFRSGEPYRYLITSIRLRLSREFHPCLGYAGLREELAGHVSGQPTALEVSDAVIRLRRRKLPDPARTGNAGSFFKNPVVGAERAARLRAGHPGLLSWPAADDAVKLSAAWMIERCGLKGYRRGDAGVSARHALVLVNHGSASGAEILQVADTVRAAVTDTFGVLLEPEPRIVDFAA
jgi:UDP-N-acetylmuramate dehydrogenase